MTLHLKCVSAFLSTREQNAEKEEETLNSAASLSYSLEMSKEDRMLSIRWAEDDLLENN
jgi:hypothetical protein